MANKLLFGVIGMFLLIFAACSNNVEELPSSDDAAGTVPAGSSNQQLCVDAGGKWIDGANECEGISAQYCQEIGGQFEECGSACRNDPNAEICTMQCVQYCSFE